MPLNLGCDNNESTDGRINTNDGGPAWASSFGVSGEVVTSADATSTPLVITDAPTSGQKIVLDDLEITSEVETIITLRTTSGNKVLGKYAIAENQTLQITTRGKKKAPAANQTLEVLAADAGNIHVGASYHSEA